MFEEYTHLPKDQLKAEYKSACNEYTTTKDRAYRLYYDPIDFPEDYKHKLQQLSFKKADLRRAMNPEKVAAQEAAADKKKYAKQAAKYKAIEAIEKEVQAEMVDLVMAEKIVREHQYGTKKKAAKMIEASNFRTISDTKTYMIQGRAEIKYRRRIAGL